MNAFFKFRARAGKLRLFECYVMSKNNGKVYYAVGRGREIGIYDTWKECKVQTEGVSDAKFRKFFSLEEAQEFVNFWKNYSSPVKEESNESEQSVSIKDKPLIVDRKAVLAKVQLKFEKGVLGRCNGLLSLEFKDKLPKTSEDFKISDKAQSAEEKIRLESPKNSRLASPSVPNCHLQCSPSHPTSEAAAAESTNVNVLALNLRLDAFEKRFDACLKEVGAIASEISHIRSEVKEMKESLSSAFSGHLAMGSGNLPRKGKDGLLQTTLAFASPNAITSPLKSYSTYRDTTNSGEGGTRRGKNLKRKLSRSSSFEDSKRFADDGADHDDLLDRLQPERVDVSSFTRDEDDFVEVYTDGASHSNGKDDAKAGIGIWWGDDHPLNVGEPVAGAPTNNTAEIQAARVAMELAVKCGLKKLKILTDSEFLINCATRWIQRWKKNGWHLVNGGPVKNRVELEKLDRVAGRIAVRWEKVPAHAGVRGNEMADRLANEGAVKYKR